MERMQITEVSATSYPKKTADEIAVELYGEGAVARIMEEISKVKTASNFRFTSEYLQIGIYFIGENLAKIDKKEETPVSLTNLVTRSLGEAAIYYFQVLGRE